MLFNLPGMEIYQNKKQVIDMAKIDFGGVVEDVVTREEFPLSKAQEVLKDEVVAVLGYGVQGPAQALNMKENGIRVIVGQNKNTNNWDKAIKDGWIPGETLFSLEDAADTRDHHPIFNFRCRANADVAKNKTPSQTWKCSLLFPWVFNNIQKPDWGCSPARCGCNTRRP